MPGKRVGATAGILALVLAACGQGDKREPAPEPAAQALSRAPEPAPPAHPVPATDDRPVVTPEQRKRYRAHLSAGRALSQQRKWGEAASEFEKALDIIPMDARALSELGWAAFQAGDYERARAATLDAVQVAVDAQVRAASLYNLGRLAEATGERDEAARHYRASLALRGNAAVRQRLAEVHAATSPDKGVPAPGAPPTLDIGPVATVDELCARVLAELEPDTAAPPTVTPEPRGCSREPRQVADVELLFVGDEHEESVHLIARGPRGWSVKALLGTVYHPRQESRQEPRQEQAGQGADSVHEELEIARFDIEPIGERKALWLETVQTSSDAGQGVKESSRVRSLTLCSWPPGTAELACHLQVPLEAEYQRTGSKPGQRGAELRSVRRIEIEVRDSGTARVVLVEGKKTDDVAPLLGERTLW